MSYKNTIVKKPWGYEYLTYSNEEVALWFLYIKPDHTTSLHCHPKKTTGLIILDGTAKISFLTNYHILNPGNKIMIRKGLFHSTKAISEKGTYLFEIETPVDKQDLVRFKDSYGREGKPYENSIHEVPKLNNCLWFNEVPNKYNFSNCTLTTMHISDTSIFKELNEEDNIMFLRGGLQTNYKQFVAGPGDIVSSSTIKQLIVTFNTVEPSTLIMLIKPNIL